MSFKIKADVNTAKNVVVQNKNTGLSITTQSGDVYNTDGSGRIVVPVADKDYTNYIVREFPLSQYGELYDNANLNISSTGFVLNFNREVSVFIGGLYDMVPVQSLNLNVNNNAANKTINIYVQLELGVPSYHFNISEEGETPTNMFIGKVTTNGSAITNININAVSRFSVYRASATNIGGAFPVSSGHPTQTGTINW